jgi:hypothetical protein
MVLSTLTSGHQGCLPERSGLFRADSWTMSASPVSMAAWRLADFRHVLHDHALHGRRGAAPVVGLASSTTSTLRFQLD